MASSSSLKWGRSSTASFFTNVGVFLILFGCPLLVVYFWRGIHSYDGSLLWILERRAGESFLPPFTTDGLLIYSLWYAFHVLLYLYLPSAESYGIPTPSGHKLKYQTNGLFAWLLSVVLFVAMSVGFGFFSPAIVSDNWGSLLVATNVYGYLLAVFAFVKAHYFPSHADDRKFSNSTMYDFFMGVELNPRIGKLFDFKLFHNGRPGIVGWTIINLSFAFAQYRDFGHVTNSMVLINYLQLLYVVDFFYNERWYLRTIDIAHDHFGFYLAWGDSVWLPFMYTLQAQYIYRNNIDLEPALAVFVFVLGSFSYYLFRSINSQKDYVRKKKGDCVVWGKKAEVIHATYVSNGKKFDSLLIASGYWGLARHFNYLADILLSLAMCMTSGANAIMPYFYVIYMIILLVHRVERDDERCSGKYGKFWTEYKKKVAYKIVPYVY